MDIKVTPENESYKQVAKELWKKVEETRDKYIVPDNVEIIPYDRNKELVMCSLLIEEMEKANADHDELMTALTYCGIIVDSKKYHLDAMKAYEDLGIDDICEKYIKKEKENEVRSEN